MSLAAHPARLAGWGRYPAGETAVIAPRDIVEACEASTDAIGAIARGNGRAYGDAAIGRRSTILAGKLDRLIAIDETIGLVTCEAGMILSDLIDALLPRGLFPPVTPGTRFVTIGGMIAADVHGKNHHRDGSFCDHLLWIELACGDGMVRRCSPRENADLFAASCGGMGLTGMILRACFRARRIETAAIRQRTIRTRDLGEAIAVFEASLRWTYSVAWIDCLATGRDLGRSVVLLGEHAVRADVAAAADPMQRSSRRERRVPIDLPSSMLGGSAVRLFNKFYHSAQQPGERIVDLDPFFYPLDAIRDWNRIYGRRGFVQYQCVLPLDTSRAGLTQLLKEISASGQGSFLAVLKRMGAESFGLLSFPMPGYTLALDFPVNRTTLALLDRLDAITAMHGGRIYLAKDARATPAFAAGYPRIDRFRAIRRRHGLDRRFASKLSERLAL